MVVDACLKESKIPPTWHKRMGERFPEKLDASFKQARPFELPPTEAPLVSDENDPRDYSHIANGEPTFDEYGIEPDETSEPKSVKGNEAPPGTKSLRFDYRVRIGGSQNSEPN
jgi:hypothetical protein